MINYFLILLKTFKNIKFLYIKIKGSLTDILIVQASLNDNQRIQEILIYGHKLDKCGFKQKHRYHYNQEKISKNF